MGSIGLGIFAVMVWQGLPKNTLGIVLTFATLAWVVTSVGVWQLRESLLRRLRARSQSSNRTLSTSVRITRSTKKEIR